VAVTAPPTSRNQRSAWAKGLPGRLSKATPILTTNIAIAAYLAYVVALLIFCAAIGCFDGIESVCASPPVGPDVWVVAGKL